MESIWITGKRYWNQFSTFDSPRDHPQRIQSDDVQINREAIPLDLQARGRTSLTSEDGQNYGTIPMPMFATKPLTMSSTIPVDIPQNYVVGQQRQQIWEQFDKFPTPSTCSCWKIRFKSQVTTCSDFTSEAMLWIKEVEMVDSLDELKSSRFVSGTNCPDFEMLDAKIASALNKIIQNSQFKKKVSLEEQKVQKDDRFLRGRQIAFMMYDFFRANGAHDTVLDYADNSLLLFAMTTFRNSIRDGTKFYCRCQKFHPMTSWKVCTSSEYVSSHNSKTVLELYDMEIHQKRSVPNYQKLKTMVKRRKDQKLRLRNFDARHGRIETGAMFKNHRGLSGVEGGKGTCYQWKGNCQCSQRDQCSFRHETQDRAQKPEHTAATPSEPSASRGRSVSRKRSFRGKSNHGSNLRQPCRYDFRGTCTRTPCEYWHPSECQFYKNETGCEAWDKCLSPHFKFDEQRNEKPKKGHFPKRRESDDKNAVAVVKSVSQLGCVSQDSDALVSQGRMSRRNPLQKVLERIQRVRFTMSTLRHASIREKKGPSLEKINVKVPHQRSPYAMKFEDRSHEKTERQ